MSTKSMQAVEANPAEVVGLLAEQRELCRQLAGLAEGQRALITGNAPERLLEVLADRQRLLDRMTSLGVRLQPYQQNWREVRSRLGGEQGRRADELVAEVNALLQRIVQKDEADGQLLSARKQAAAGELLQLRQNREVGAAYAAAASGGLRDWTE